MQSCFLADRVNGIGRRPGPGIRRVFSRPMYGELLDHSAKVVVLSRGMEECLHVPRETLDLLKEREVTAHVLSTAEAVQLYNHLAETEPVGGLFHTTC
jgi:hypothetical protein